MHSDTEECWTRWDFFIVREFAANIEFGVPHSQLYLVLGLVGLVWLVLPLLLLLGLVRLALW